MAGSTAGALYVGPGWDGALLALGRYLDRELTEDPPWRPRARSPRRFCAESIEAWSTDHLGVGHHGRRAIATAAQGRPSPSSRPTSGTTVAAPTVTTPIVTVRGEAELEVPPDLADLSVTCTRSGRMRRRGPGRAGRRVARPSAGCWPNFGGDRPASATTGAPRRPGLRPAHAEQDHRLHAGSFSTRGGRTTSRRCRRWSWRSAELPNEPGRRPVVVAAPRQSAPTARPGWPRSPTPAAGPPTTRRRSAPAVAELVEVSDLEGGFGGPRMRWRVRDGQGWPTDTSVDFEPAAADRRSGQVTVRVRSVRSSVGDAAGTRR